MKKLLSAAVVVLLTGCELGAANEYRNAVPTADTVKMNVPGSTGQALTNAGTARQGLENEQAAFYVLTRQVSQFVNGAGWVVLSLVKQITEYPATSVSEEKGVAVWGPYTEALSPNTWRLTVTKNKDNDFSYVLQAKAKNDGDDAFLTILSGNHVGTGKVTGHGSFLLDMDAAQKLPEHDKDSKGTAKYTYSRESLDANTDIEAVFTQVLDKDTQRLVNATYHYVSNEKTGGSLEFNFQGDFDEKKNTQLENATLNSRWDRSGAGRTDVKIAGGDLASGTEASASECWDSDFLSKYLTASFDPSLNYGSEAACGALATAQYSSLRL